MKKLSKSTAKKSVAAYVPPIKCNCGPCGGTAVVNGKKYDQQSLKAVRKL